ncbi:MAG TPA: dual specificity protein phosphatase family protein [Stellaceae bacterium]|nr:dual specificity protein phosphatase family protein [Stellaceae bacterium]
MTALDAGDAGTAGSRRPKAARLGRWLWNPLAAIGLAVLGIAGAYGTYCGIIIYDGNFHAVQPGVLYRSAQMSRGELEMFARRYGIKAVLNLRGAHAGEAWYDGEIAAVRDLGIAHYDYPISAKRVVTRPQIEQILAIVRRAPKPLLIHCRSGADRSGLVAALYDYAIRGESTAEADRQLSLAYGHFPYLASRSGAMDDSFWAFVRAPAARP